MTNVNTRAGGTVATIGAIVVLLVSSCGDSSKGGSGKSDLSPAESSSSPAVDVRDRAVMKQMIALEDAARACAAQHRGKFPTTIDDDFLSHLPNKALTNPFTEKTQSPELGNITDLDALHKGKPPTVNEGVVQYNSLDGGKVYAIIAGGKNNEAVRDPDNYDRTFILSNIKKYCSDAAFLREPAE